MALRDIIGQERALRILSGTLKRDRIPSAVLLSGDSGVGKRLASVNYAKAINCLEPLDYDCCDKCVSCRKADAGTHPDVTVIMPENDEIKIETVRNVEDMLSLRPHEGRRKIVIIDDADMMNIYAANAFLKTLEEPPHDSLIILISSNPAGLPDTIRSRCTNVKFYPLPADRCKEAVSKNGGIKDIALALNLAMGRPGLALSMDFMKEKELFSKLLDAMIKGEKDSWADRSAIRSWLDMAGIFLRDMAISLEFGVKSPELLAFSEIKTQNPRLKTILDAYQELEKIKGLLDFNLNKSITWNYASSIMRSAAEV
jgi:DNA polymerase-3 subunit delta'